MLYYVLATKSSSISTPVCALANQVVSPCYKWCEEKTCQNLLRPPQSCTTECEQNICVCRDNLYRNACNRCVPMKKCALPCKRYEPLTCTGENEQLNGCYDPLNAKVCPGVGCSTPRDIFFKSAARSHSGLCALTICDCKDGYFRNNCGKCVSAIDCYKKCRIKMSDPCRGPNEIRIKRARNHKPKISQFSNQQSSRKLTEFESMIRREKSCQRKKMRRIVCVCKPGYVRDKCRQCVRADSIELKGSKCLVTNPCANSPIVGMEFQCLNSCNQRDCRNYLELKRKSCGAPCVYSCHCSKNKGLWFNGTHCVPSRECPKKISTLMQSWVEYVTLYDLVILSPGNLERIYEVIGYSP